MPVKFKNSININDQYTLPTQDGSNGQALITDGSGNISFGSTGVPAPLYIDYTNNRLGIGTTSPNEKLEVAGNIAVAGTVDGVDIAALAAANTGDQTLPTDFVSAANGGTFGGTITVSGNLDLSGGTGKKIILGTQRSYTLPAQGTKMRILTLSNGTSCRVYIDSSENAYNQPIVLDIFYNSAGSAKPVIHRDNNYQWHTHSNDIRFTSDTSGHIYAEKVTQATGRSVNIRKVEEFKGSVTLLDGSTTTTGGGSNEVLEGRFGTLQPNTLVIGGHSINDIDITSEVSDADDHLMTALAIKNKIEDYGYTGDQTLPTDFVSAANGGTFAGDVTIDGNLDLAATHTITIGPNATWSKSLIIGNNANNSTTNAASIGTTNGNLHLDAAQGGSGTYLNYYDGTAGVAFGNGATGIVAWMGPDGDLWKGTADNNGSKYWHAGNDGSGSGLDADLLDGINSTSFLRGDVADEATQLTVNTLIIGSSAKIKFQNNDFIRYDDSVGVGRFHFDADGGTNNASVQAATFVGALSGNATSATNATYSTYTDILTAVDDRDMKPSTSGVGSTIRGVRPFFTSLGGMTGTANSDYQDVLVLDTYSDTSGGQANALSFDKSSKLIKHWQAGQTATSWGTPKTIAYTDSDITGNASTVTNGVYTTGAQTITGLKSFAGAIRITETGTAQHILIGNQDSAGVSKPGMIRGVNGGIQFGFGNSWSGEGGTMTNTLSLDTSNNATFVNNVTVGGNLIVNGTTTTLNTQTVEVKDNILQLNTTQGTPDTATAATSGISVYRGDGVTQASLIFDEADDTWDLTNSLAVAGNVGIGTTSPSGLLHLKSDDSAKLIIQADANNDSDDNTKNAIIQFGTDGGDNSSHITHYNGSGTHVLSIDDSINVTNNGNVGIGTTSAFTVGGTARLSIQSSSVAISIGASNVDLSYIRRTDAGKYQWQTYNGGNSGELQLQPYGGSVGIGTTSPSEKLEVAGKVYIESQGVNWNETTPGLVRGALHLDPAGSGADNTGNAITFGASDRLGGTNAQAGIYTRSDGAYGTKMYFATADDYSAGSKTRMMIDYNGNVGVGTTSPNYKLSVSGAIQGGGKITYTKVASSLNTTGYDVAGILASASGNGLSCGFTFTCFGHANYQKIVYSCYNASGTWHAVKLIDEGTDKLDIVVSAISGSTITFKYKTRSGTLNYTPRVIVEAVGSSINSTYA